MPRYYRRRACFTPKKYFLSNLHNNINDPSGKYLLRYNEIMFDIKIKGIDEAKSKLDELAKKANDISGTRSVSLQELLTNGFMLENTKFDNANDFFDKGGFNFKNSEEFKAIDDLELDKWVKANSKFSTWKEMIDKAVIEYYKKGLGF